MRVLILFVRGGKIRVWGMAEYLLAMIIGTLLASPGFCEQGSGSKS